jgi:hypothetical protein
VLVGICVVKTDKNVEVIIVVSFKIEVVVKVDSSAVVDNIWDTEIVTKMNQKITKTHKTKFSYILYLLTFLLLKQIMMFALNVKWIKFWTIISQFYLLKLIDLLSLLFHLWWQFHLEKFQRKISYNHEKVMILLWLSKIWNFCTRLLLQSVTYREP